MRASAATTFGPNALTDSPRGGYHLLTPGDNYYSALGNAPHVRLSYVAAPSTTDIDSAIRRLGTIISEP